MYYLGLSDENNILVWLCEYETVPRGEEMLRVLFKIYNVNHWWALLVLAERGRVALLTELLTVLNPTTEMAIDDEVFLTICHMYPALMASYQSKYDQLEVDVGPVIIASCCLLAPTTEARAIFDTQIATLSSAAVPGPDPTPTQAQTQAQEHLNMLLYEALWKQADLRYVEALLAKGANLFAPADPNIRTSEQETVLNAAMAFITEAAFKLVSAHAIAAGHDPLELMKLVVAVVTQIKDRWVVMSRPELFPPVGQVSPAEVKTFLLHAIDLNAVPMARKLVTEYL